MSYIAHQVRLLLEDSADSAGSLSQVVDSIECSIADWSPSESQLLLSSLEDIYHDVIDHDLFHQVNTLLTVLYHLRPIIPAVSIITTWFDLILRPALREPKLPTSAVKYAKELVTTALDKPDEDNVDKIKNFRRRLFDLYLLDAYNETSGDDALEWAELDREQRNRKSFWKANLQDVLVTFGILRPQDLMSNILHCYATPSSRLQLLILLNAYSSQPAFPPLVPILVTHPLFNSLILSLQVDGSSTACTVGLTFFAKLLPILAVYAPNALKSNLPKFLTILAGVISWKTRQPIIDPELMLEHDEEETEEKLEIWPQLEWERLIMTFDATASVAPSADRYFTHLYYLFPCTVLEFIRNPIQYLDRHGAECPYTSGWEIVLDEDKVRKKSESLLRGHVIHPAFLATKDAESELNDPPFWREHDLSRIIGECTMMDIRNAAIGIQQNRPAILTHKPSIEALPNTPPHGSTSDSSRVAETIHRHGRYRVSMQDIITTSVALKSGLDIEVADEDSTAAWPNVLYSSMASPGRRSISLPPDSASVRSHTSHNEHTELPSHVAEAVSGLQRQLLLLSNELNLELWLARKNAQFITHLNQDRSIALHAEGERQGLHNKLRQYKVDSARLQKELKNHKEQASSVKNKYADWNAELQQKLSEFREQKKGWMLEVSQLRAADLQHKATFEAQGKLLASATNKVFELETRIKETAHKVDRLHDYEKQIEQLVKMQRLWEDDIKQLKEQTEQMRVMDSDYQGLRLHLQSYQEGQSELEAEARRCRDKVQVLESQLELAQKKLEAASASKVAAFAKASEAASSNLVKTNQKLRDENADLRDENEELKAMVEVLKARERPGLLFDPSMSPTMSVFM